MKADIERKTGAAPGSAIVFGKYPTWAIWLSIIPVYVIGVFLSDITEWAPLLGVAWLVFVIIDSRSYRKLKKTYHIVELTVQFTEEEKQIIKENKLRSTVVLERAPDATQVKQAKGLPEDTYNLRIGSLVSGAPDIRHYTTPAEAKLYEQEVADILPSIKEYITGNLVQEGDEGKKSFEY